MHGAWAIFRMPRMASLLDMQEHFPMRRAGGCMLTSECVEASTDGEFHPASREKKGCRHWPLGNSAVTTEDAGKSPGVVCAAGELSR